MGRNLFRLKTTLECVLNHTDEDQEQVYEVTQHEYSSSSLTKKRDEELYQAAQLLRVRLERLSLYIREHQPFWTYLITVTFHNDSKVICIRLHQLR